MSYLWDCLSPRVSAIPLSDLDEFQFPSFKGCHLLGLWRHTFSTAGPDHWKAFSLPEGYEDHLALTPNTGLGWGLSQEINGAVGLASDGKGCSVVTLVFVGGCE